MNRLVKTFALLLIASHTYAEVETYALLDSGIEQITESVGAMSLTESPEPQGIEKQILALEEHKIRLEQLSLANQWPSLPKTKLLRFGDESTVIPKLRTRLMLLGDLDELVHCELDDPLFGIDLHNALIKFQKRHGLKADGIYGPATRRELNVSPGSRALQITVNIDRLKSFNPVSDRYIQVNIPEYRLRLFEHGAEILSMKTIVGKKKRKTPVFNTSVNRLVINPSWHVPKSIAYKDIVPELESDPDYLKKMNLKLVTGWGNSKTILSQDQVDLDKLYKGENYQRFWEPPSNNGTLGSVKFLTTGPYSVYLHDTSAKRLFEKETRAFSSGCIRVEKPRSLANELMRMTHGWEKEKLDTYFNDTERKTINMPDTIDLHVTYWTAFIDENGLNFRRDPYKKDRWEIAQLKQTE